MKYLISISITSLFALSAVAQQSYPLGHHVHAFQRAVADGRVTSQGWDPTYAPDDQSAKERMVANIPTYPVGLPGSLEPGDLRNTGCPVNSTIRSASDVAGLPTVSLAGVAGPVYLIHDCDMSGSILRVQDGMKVAAWGSAFRQVVGSSGSSGQIWIVDSLINADPNDNAGISCLGDTPCRVMYSEVLGGDDVMKLNPGDVCFKSHLHGYDRDSTAGSASSGGEHTDGVQINQGSDFTVINCNIEGPFRTSNAPLFAGTAGKIYNFRVTDTLASGGTNGYKLGSKDTTDWQNAVFMNSQLLADAQGVSWGSDSMGQSAPCTLGGASSQYSGEGNRASNGSKTGTDHLGRAWNFDDSCNRNGVSAGNKAFFDAEKQKLEGWAQAIRAAAGAPSTPPTQSASMSVTTVPVSPYSANDVTVAATVTGCQPALYRFECGDTPGAFDDKSSVASFHICGTMAPGNYTVGVLAQGGTCQTSVSKQIPITVSPPPAPVLQ